MTRIVKEQIPAATVLRLDEYALEDLAVMGHEQGLRRSRDGRWYTRFSFAKDDPRTEEVLGFLSDVCGSEMRLGDVTGQYAFETTTAPLFLDFESTVVVHEDEGVRVLADPTWTSRATCLGVREGSAC